MFESRLKNCYLTALFNFSHDQSLSASESSDFFGSLEVPLFISIVIDLYQLNAHIFKSFKLLNGEIGGEHKNT